MGHAAVILALQIELFQTVVALLAAACLLLNGAIVAV